MRRLFRILVFWIVLLSFAAALFNVYKDLPKGVSVEGEVRRVPAASVSFFSDYTYIDAGGQRHSDQHIFDEVFRMIRGARRYVLLDMFLYNEYQGASPEKTRALSSELTELLLEKKKQIPAMMIAVVTDPINETYGGDASEQFEKLRAAGITLITTNLSKLRDSNPAYSGFWRVALQWLGNSDKRGIAPHPFQSGSRKVTVRSWLALFNFKANHRKLLVVDEEIGGKMKLSTLITSGNPHDGSSAHGNIAIKVSDFLHRDAILSEEAVAEFSGLTVPKVADLSLNPVDESGSVEIQLLTEGAIKKRTLAGIGETEKGDSIDVAMFYLSEREVINTLVAAAHRGVAIRLVLDPNKDAFGHKKNGVPNRPVADELLKRHDSVKIRWCDTHGEQCHAKLLLIGKKKDGYEMIGGSANLTRRNISNYNLETSVSVRSPEKIKAITDAYEYFETIWENPGGKIYTADYEKYQDDALYKKVMYHIMERTGLSSF